MNEYGSQKALGRSGDHLLTQFVGLFSCHEAWDVREARFKTCILPVISLLPDVVAIIVLIIRLLRPLSRKRPQWLQNIIQESPSGDEWPKNDAIKQLPGWNRCVLALCAAGLTLNSFTLLWPKFDSRALLPIISWAAIVLLLTVEKPTSAPLGCLTILITISATQLILRLNIPFQFQVTEIPIILSTLCALASVTVIFNQPLRNSVLSSEEIAEPFTSPTSDLRSPEELLTPWQFMTVSWMKPLLSVASHRQLNDDDVWSLAQEFQHKLLHERFRELKGSVITRLLKANGLDLIILTVLSLLELTAHFASPLLLQLLLRSMENGAAPMRAAIVYAVIALVVRLVKCQSSVFSVWYQRRCYERSRGEIVTMLHEKVLARKTMGSIINGKENGDKKEPASMGKILNMMKNDAYGIAQAFWQFQSLITGPIGLILSAVLVWQIIGWPALLGVTTVIVAQIMNVSITRELLKWERVRRAATDVRLQKSSQFVEAIRHLRWYGWQEYWLNDILTSRNEELKQKVRTALLGVLINFINTLASYLFPVVAFYAYTAWAGLPLTIDIAFPALQLFQSLQNSLREIPEVIMMLLQTRIAVQRIEEFMKEPDKENDEAPTVDPDGDIQLGLQDASFAWPGHRTNVLHDLTLKFPVGLTIILGEVGSGKTALLQALLGEMDTRAGRVAKTNTIFGYCAQSPWLQSMSIRENILFSCPYHEQRYREVLEACQLNPDLDSFPDGDHSLIGENGIGLSGGQRARVALARAVYSHATVLLLDDPLSALDHQTADAIVEKAFQGPLMEGRTIILVTHRVNLVQQFAQRTIEISAGTARVIDCWASQQNLSPKLLNDLTGRQQDKKENEGEKVATKFLEDEKRVHGGVKAGVYWEYIKAGKLRYWAMLIVITAVIKILGIGDGYFLKEWGEAYNRQPSIRSTLSGLFARFPPPEVNVSPWLWALLGIAIIRSVFVLFGYIISVAIVYTAGKGMFKEIMQRVSYATFRFYDITPVGRLMNRLTSDVGTIDDNISYQLRMTVFHAVTWIGSLIVVASITPIFLVFSILLSVTFALIFSRFLPASQSLRRLEMVSLSPLMSNFGTLLQGLTTVRAFSAQSHFQDRVIKAWLMYRFDALSACSAFLLTLLALYTGVSPGLTAFVLNAAALYVSATHALCQGYGKLQMDFVSVERIVELLHLQQEHRGSINLPAAWPSYCRDIIFDNVTVRYAPHSTPALRNITFCIPGGSTTALLGRTGSGKSTLALSLLATILPLEGSIIIDGIDIAKCNPQALRHRVTFLAQDPVLFPGSMRQNLDPLSAYTDEDCSWVLQRICGKHDWTLNTEIGPGGSNMSQGQRQLVGLARAVLRRSSIIILDEATASIDVETAQSIQSILREELSESTIITIAHRLEAVRGADFFIRLDGGVVTEMGKVEMNSTDENN